MKIINTTLVKKEDKYHVIEEILNTKEVRKTLKITDLYLYKIYRGNCFVYKDANCKDFINIIDYQGCEFINARNMSSIEFLESDFFIKHRNEIIKIVDEIRSENEYQNCSKYKILETPEFLTSEFANNHYEEIYSTLNNIINTRENAKVKSKVRR